MPCISDQKAGSGTASPVAAEVFEPVGDVEFAEWESVAVRPSAATRAPAVTTGQLKRRDGFHGHRQFVAVYHARLTDRRCPAAAPGRAARRAPAVGRGLDRHRAGIHRRGRDRARTRLRLPSLRPALEGSRPPDGPAARPAPRRGDPDPGPRSEPQGRVGDARALDHRDHRRHLHQRAARGCPGSRGGGGPAGAPRDVDRTSRPHLAFNGRRPKGRQWQNCRSAEGVGFEPTVTSLPQRFSSPTEDVSDGDS